MEYKSQITPIESGFFVSMLEVDGIKCKECTSFMGTYCSTREFAEKLIEDFFYAKTKKEKEDLIIAQNIEKNAKENAVELYYALEKLKFYISNLSIGINDFDVDYVHPDLIPPVRKLLEKIRKS